MSSRLSRTHTFSSISLFNSCTSSKLISAVYLLESTDFSTEVTCLELGPSSSSVSIISRSSGFLCGVYSTLLCVLLWCFPFICVPSFTSPSASSVVFSSDPFLVSSLAFFFAFSSASTLQTLLIIAHPTSFPFLLPWSSLAQVCEK